MSRPSVRSSPVGRPSGVARRPVSAPRDVARTLQIQQSTIDALSTQLASLQRSQQPPARASGASAPEKCKLDMSQANFRSWRRSVLSWIALNRWSHTDSLMHIRLLCSLEVQSALDAKFTVSQWLAFTVKEVLDAIESLVTSTTNQAVLWDIFFSGHQASNESIKEYFNKCLQQCLDCNFRCPNCSGDLSDYILVRKVVVGLHDPVLKRELFQCVGDFASLDELRDKCLSFETAARDAQGGKSQVFGASVSLPPVGDEVQCGEGLVAVLRKPPVGPRPSSPPSQNGASAVGVFCNNCARRHAPDRKACPARELVCWGCQGKGHLAKCCRKSSRGGRKKTSEVGGGVGSLSSVRMSSVSANRLPKLKVEVRGVSEESLGWCQALAIADTGAEVCVAGLQHLRSLGLSEGRLRESNIDLVDIVDVKFKALGWAVCEVRLNGLVSRQSVYFVKKSSCLFLSLSACIDLGLVPRDFPFVKVPASVGSAHPLAVTPSVPVAPPLASVGSAQCTSVTPSIPARPVAPPLPLIEENVDRLQGWLLQHFSSTTFNTSTYPLPVMTGAPHRIHVVSGAKPVAYHTPLTIPKHWEAEVRKQLEEDVKRGVLRQVPAGEATEWCSRMVVTSKKNGQPRRTVDYQPLNAACLRETHHTPAPFDMVSNVPGHTFKTVADAFSGFHQVPLDEESIKLTTFITPWGRYQYLRTPMGHCAAPDAYTKRFDDAIAAIDRKYKCIDDVLLYDDSVESAFWHTYEFLETCFKCGITLNPDKFKFCKRDVEFVGFDLGWESYHPTSGRLSAIRDFPMPAEPTITDIRSWHGLVNQLAPFMATAPVMAPFRDLLKKSAKKKVYWDSVLQQKFEEAKGLICQLASDGLRYYDKSRPTAAVTDWSREGIGFVVLQQYCQCVSADTPFCCKGGWRLALCGSRQLTPAEESYAAVEGEALAVVWCLRKARLFLLGCPNLVIVTDHRPLVKLLGNRELKDIVNPRLFRLKEKTLQFRFHIKYLPGKKNCAADTLSRYPTLQTFPESEDVDFSDDVTVAMVTTTAAALGAESGVVLDQDSVACAGREDPVYQLLYSRVSANDWPRSKSEELACLRPFFNVRERLSVLQDLVTYTYEDGCTRLVIPDALRDQISANLHSGHQGLDSMLRRARQTVYWPGMVGDLQHHRARCETCEVNAPSQVQEPLIMTQPPEYPFQQAVADLFQLHNRNYLAYADRLTGWVEVAHLPHGATSGHLIRKFRQYFIRWGSPEELATDGGTNLTSDEMYAFLKKWGVATRLSSAHYPQSNGRAEAGVRVAKRILRDNTGDGGSLDTDNVAKALLQYLNTPLHGEKKSPAQLATGRQLRDSIPVVRQYYKVDQHWRKTLRERERRMASKNTGVCEKYDVGARALAPLHEGQRVRVQDPSTKVWDRSGTIIEVGEHRQYKVRLDGSGRPSLRNRRHLRLMLGGDSPTEVSVATPSGGNGEPSGGVASRPRRARQRPLWLADFVQ